MVLLRAYHGNDGGCLFALSARHRVPKQEDSSTLGLGSSRAQAVDTQQLSSAQRASGVADASSSVDGGNRH